MVKIVINGVEIETEREKIALYDDILEIDNDVIKAIKEKAREDVLTKYDKVIKSLANK